MDILAKQAGVTDADALQEIHEAFQVFTRLANLYHFSRSYQFIIEIVTAHKNRFRQKARATAKIITMSKILSPKKKITKQTKPMSKAKVSHKKQRRRSKIIVEDYDSKKVTDITALVSDAAEEDFDWDDIDDN